MERFGMPGTSSWNPTSRISRVKVLVAAALTALTLSFGLQAANPPQASAMMSRATCDNLGEIWKGLSEAKFWDAAEVIRVLIVSEGCAG